MVDAHIIGKQITTTDITRLIIGGQTGVDGVRFCIAPSVHGEDLTDITLGWFLQFKNKFGMGEPIPLFPVYENGLVKLPWVPGTTATQVAGKLQIQLYATKIVEGVVTKKWVSAPAVVYVEENLNPEAITPLNPTMLDQYIIEFTAVLAGTETFAFNASQSAAAALASELAARASEEAAGLSAGSAASSEMAAGLSEVAADESAAEALASEQAAEAAKIISVDAAATANRWMEIDGQPHIVTRTSKNGHIIKTVSLYVEAP